MDFGASRPLVSVRPPGVRSRAWIDRLASTECPALTTRRARRAELSGAPQDPIVWTRARGANVEDVDGNIFVDLTSGFGAAFTGHAHPRIVARVHQQTDRLSHALGDLHPSDVKIELLERLARLAPYPNARVILGLNGGDAIEAALKTALLSAHRPGVLAFEGGYHGLHYGPLAACGYRLAFREPFAAQLSPHVSFVRFPITNAEAEASLVEVRRAFQRSSIGAVLVEPIQGRGGVRVPPPGFLRELERVAHEAGALVIADEIMTGLGRCGSMLRSVHEGCTPDLICLGKALGGGFPISACIGRDEVMKAWGDPSGEALHTGTFFGHPIGCAAALATLDVISEERLDARGLELGAALRGELEAASRREVRGAGLLLGIELESVEQNLAIIRTLMEHGYLVLPAGTQGNVLQILPPATIDRSLLKGFVELLPTLLRP